MLQLNLKYVRKLWSQKLLNLTNKNIIWTYANWSKSFPARSYFLVSFFSPLLIKHLTRFWNSSPSGSSSLLPTSVNSEMHQNKFYQTVNSALELPCSLFSGFISPFSIEITSLGEERAGLCATFICLFCTHWFLSFLSSSWCQGLAAACDCDTPMDFSINVFV